MENRRLGYYVQSHTYDRDPKRWLSMLPLGEPSRHTSHIIISAFHLNYTKDDGAGNHKIYLNDEIYDQGDNIRVWEEAAELQQKGILVFGLLGGGGIWEATGLGGGDAEFDKGYKLIKDMIAAKKLDGVDLNVEPHNPIGVQDIGNEGVTKVIKKLKADFPHLLFTMAPGGGELLSPGGLSGVNYQTLFREEGMHDAISWFNVQLYNNWGTLDVDEFSSYVAAGFPANKLVLNLVGNPDPEEAADGWIDGPTIKTGVEAIMKKFTDMGGIDCWDWYNATLDGKEPVEHPEAWSDFVSAVLFPDGHHNSAS
ncbi:hypothetical protein K4K58_000564 [Colletotrichum sp. SAR11_239]|nr:hypothetical protein K4K58_000564 [Colletotrichum sp. SAR11_239]